MLDTTTTAPKTRKATLRLKHYEVVKLHAFMKPLIVQEGEYATYIDGWSDERVAREASVELGPLFTEAAAGDFRRRMFGNFPPAPKVVENKTLQARIAELEKRVAAIELRFGVRHD